MNLYIAKIVFNINISDGKNLSQFDEQLRLIEASTFTDAFYKARLLGKKEEHLFLNEKKETVSWKFIDVSDVQPINELKHGTEIYSSTHVDAESTDYINFIRQKALVLQTQDATFA